jgi:Ni,Fe-hydrogenase III large subunit
MAQDSIASDLGRLAMVSGAKPWPRYEVDTETWEAIARQLGQGHGDLLSLWGERDCVHLALRAPDISTPTIMSLRIENGGFPSVGRHHPPAIRLERAVLDLYGHIPEGMPDVRRWLDHGAWGVRAPLGANEPAEPSDPAAYDFLPVTGRGLHQIPVGPVHAGIIEPGHFRFTANGETVARLEERLGYVHKGVDGLLTDTDLAKAARVVARVSGDSTVALSFAFARAVEAALDIEVPKRAQMLRGIMAELERIANHVGDIGAICNDATLTLIHAYCGIFRERVLMACDIAFGHRLMMDEIVPGGVAKDLTFDGIRAIVGAVEFVATGFPEIVRLYDATPSLQDRTSATGIVTRDLVTRWGAGGHIGRASGRNFDTRRDLAYAPYDDSPPDVPSYTAGDVDARVWVRIREVEASLRLLRPWLAGLVEGPARAEMPTISEPREGVAMVEAFRGDVLVWLRLTGEGRVARCHVRDASWFQWPLLEAAIEGNIVADFPLCNKSFNCSYSGHDL